MRHILFLSCLLILLSCGKTDSSSGTTQPTPTDLPAVPDAEVALRFINAYSARMEPGGQQGTDDSTWLAQQPQVTAAFRTQYQHVLDSGLALDPELGLGFDPVLDAQDTPEKGFEWVKTDTAAGYITLQGHSNPDFQLILRLVQEAGTWKVDGSGIVNIPADRRAPR